MLFAVCTPARMATCRIMQGPTKITKCCESRKCFGSFGRHRWQVSRAFTVALLLLEVYLMESWLFYPVLRWSSLSVPRAHNSPKSWWWKRKCRGNNHCQMYRLCKCLREHNFHARYMDFNSILRLDVHALHRVSWKSAVTESLRIV